MDKVYIAKETMFSDLLLKIESFKGIVDKFNSKHDNKLKYNIDIKQVVDDIPYWMAKMETFKNERKNN